MSLRTSFLCAASYFLSSQSPRSKSQDNVPSTLDISSNLTLVDSLSDDVAFNIEGMGLDTISVDTSIASVAASALFNNEAVPDLMSMPKPKRKKPNTEEEEIASLRSILSGSEIKGIIMARANSVNSAMAIETREPTPTPKRNSPQEQQVPVMSRNKKKLTGKVVLERVLALNNSAVSSLETESDSKSDSNSLFSSQE